MAEKLDVGALRKRFPALDKEQVYFDNAGGSQVLEDVVTAVTTYLSSTNVQLGATYPVGQLSSASYSAAYAAAAAFIHAPPTSIVFGSSTTQLFRNLSASLYAHLSPGSEVILSLLDHEANLASWTHLAHLRGLEIKWWRPAGTPTNPVLDAASLRPLLSAKTKLVACTHASNVLGGITPLRAIADAVHAVPGALLVVDGVALAPHRAVDVAALDVDVYAFSWYKVFGPHVSMLFASDRAQTAMSSLGHYFKPSETVEDKLGLAGGSYELLAGVPAVVAYFERMGADGWEKVARHEEVLQRALLRYLTSETKHGRRITVWGEMSADAALRVPVVSFTVEGWRSKELVLAVQRRSGDRIGFRWGAFYSNRLVEQVLGIKDVDDGVVRVSLVHYNTEEEVADFIQVLDDVLSKGE